MAPATQDFTSRRCKPRGVVDETEKAKNRTKSRVRAKVEHPFLVIKRVFGFARVRYRGLEKNAHRLFVTCGLTNLFMLRHRLAQCSRETCARNSPQLPSDRRLSRVLCNPVP